MGDHVLPAHLYFVITAGAQPQIDESLAMAMKRYQNFNMHAWMYVAYIQQIPSRLL